MSIETRCWRRVFGSRTMPTNVRREFQLTFLWHGVDAMHTPVIVLAC